ncbi:hypothetical protein ES702_06838 [subsurface metagenome]
MLGRDFIDSFAVRKPAPVKRISPLPQTTPLQKVAKNNPVVKEIRKVKRVVKPIVRPVTRVALKRPSAIKRIAKIVPVKSVAPLQVTPEIGGRKAVITPVTTPFTPIAIEKERLATVKALTPKNELLNDNVKDFKVIFKPKPIIFLREIDMKIPLGQIAPVPKAMPPQKKIGKIIPQMLKKVTIVDPHTTPEPKKSPAKPIFRKSFLDIPPAITEPEKVAPEKAAVATPTQKFLQALIPGLTLFFLKR